jgi:hypothetical protein
MQDKRNYGEYQEQVNETTGNVKHGESADPCDQQNDEQNCPDTHNVLLNAFEFVTCQRLRETHFFAMKPIL